MPIISGVNNSANAVALNLLPDIEKVLVKTKPYQTPLLNLLWFSGRPAKEVTSQLGKFEWFERGFMPHQTTNKAAITASGTPASLTLTPSNTNDLTIFNVDDIVLIEETDQMAYVSSRTTSQVVLTHIDGATNLVSIQNEGMYFKIIGSRVNEYGGVRGGMRNAEVAMENYLNIFSDSVASTGRFQAGKNWTDGVDHASLVAQRIEELKLQIERYFLFAPVKGYATSGNYRVTWGHGFLGRIQSNVNSYSPTLDEDLFDDHLKEVFAKGGSRKLHMCGSNQLVEINKFVKTRYELNPNPVTNIYGVNLKEYVTPFGIVDILWNPMLDGKFANYGFTIDVEKIRLRYMANDDKGSRAFRIEEDVETPGVDGKSDKLLSDVGIEIQEEACHGILKMEG